MESIEVIQIHKQMNLHQLMITLIIIIKIPIKRTKQGLKTILMAKESKHPLFSDQLSISFLKNFNKKKHKFENGLLKAILDEMEEEKKIKFLFVFAYLFILNEIGNNFL
uniref:CSON014703 protein n=1 Tax=Culicoides sonorensis TaxID=179676 RepID=A0A336MFR7_CULSO